MAYSVMLMLIFTDFGTLLIDMQIILMIQTPYNELGFYAACVDKHASHYN